MKTLVFALLSLWVSTFLCVFAQPAYAECIPTPENNFCADYNRNTPPAPEPSTTFDPNNPNNTTEDTNGGIYADLPDGMVHNQFGIAESQEAADQQEQIVNDMLSQTAEEAVYKQRGLSMDFLNKPVELFKLTCTDGENGSKTKLTPTFSFTKDIWTSFCADLTDLNLKSAAKCMFQQFLQQQFQTVIQQLDKFKNQTFCEAFTTFANNQLSQCVKIRFDLPRGQFPGFPAFNQCLFGRVNVGVNSNGSLYAKATGNKLIETISNHGYQYAKVGSNSPTGFGGSEQQLLGDDGASSLFDASKWESAKQQMARVSTLSYLGSSCNNLDPALVAYFKDWPSQTNLLIPGIPAVIGRQKTAGGAEERVVASWKSVFNSESKTYDAYLEPGGNVTVTNTIDGQKQSFVIQSVGNWTVNPKYTYLASCYGFDIDLESTACRSFKSPGGEELSESFKQMCATKEDTQLCCNPDKTNCLEGGFVYQDNVCAKDPNNAAKDWVNDKGVCQKYDHLKGDLMICPSTKDNPVCCNPKLNDCLAIGVNICEQYVPPKQCLTATPEQLKALDPAYSALPVRVQANQMIDGRACCSTEWCNLCPQDIILSASGIDPRQAGAGIFIRQSEYNSVPLHCRGGSAPAGEVNANLGAGIEPLPDEIFQNTKEACELIKTDGWDSDKIYKVFLKCPTMQSSFSILNGVMNWANDCPSGSQVKPYSPKVINNNGCGSLESISRYPLPISKLPKVEGADPIGLCSDLPLCPAAIPGDQDPLTVASKVQNGILDALKNKDGLQTVIDTMNGTNTPPQSLPSVLNGLFGKLRIPLSTRQAILNAGGGLTTTPSTSSGGGSTTTTTSGSTSGSVTTYPQDETGGGAGQGNTNNQDSGCDSNMRAMGLC